MGKCAGAAVRWRYHGQPMIRSALRVTKRTPVAARAMVVAEHPIGADVGARVLERGGNAVDAAVATALAMTVVEPFMSTIAGGGTMLVHLARRDATVCVDFNVCAPAACHERCYPLAEGVADGALFAWRRVEGDANIVGHRSVAVPGSMAGFSLALERYGTMDLAAVLEPAIELARDGFVADWYLALTTARYLEELSGFPEAARTYLRDGRWPFRPPGIEPGDRVRQPDLAQSLALIAREGPSAFYRGPIARALVAELRRHDAFLTEEDLGAYTARVTEPLRGRYRDVDLALSPGATGGVTALEILNILDAFPASRVRWRAAEGLHRRALAVRRAFEDRLRHLGDAERVRAPWARLASKEYAREIAVGLTGGPRGRVAAPTSAADCTTHVGVVDADRNLVSLTHTAVSLWGSRVVVPGTGILLNNGMLWFDPEPGRPNSIAPGKRALVNMTPLLAFRRGRPLLTLGAPGGRKIVSAVPQVLATLVDEGCSLQAAIEAPRLHDEGTGLTVDDRVGPARVATLRRLGHEVTPQTETYASINFAKPVGIQLTRHGLEAGLDHLRPAAAAGH
jgi:gamma-glutamyltranspeptidase/glutathione hydrolase